MKPLHHRDHAFGSPIAAGLREPSDEAPTHLQRYTRFIAAVHGEVAKRPKPGLLTPTEIEVLTLVASGLSAVAATARLGRSTHPVRTHLRNVYKKLHAHGRIDALARARELGLLDADARPAGLEQAQQRSLRVRLGRGEAEPWSASAHTVRMLACSQTQRAQRASVPDPPYPAPVQRQLARRRSPQFDLRASRRLEPSLLRR